MADPELVDLLTSDVEEWNRRREAGAIGLPDLRAADLVKADLAEADLAYADLRRGRLLWTDLSGSYLTGANLEGANLRGANLAGAHCDLADLRNARLTGANLRRARLTGAKLDGADLRWAHLDGALLGAASLLGADLTGADLVGAVLVDAVVTDAVFDGARVYGISVWNLEGPPVSSQDLVITPQGEPEVTVDDLEVAQFIYQLIDNEKLRRVIDSITSKVVLILGSFSESRKEVLDRIRNELRHRDLTPVVFDFTVPESRPIIDTVELLARMSRYVIVDLSDPRMSPMELAVIAPRLTTVPIQTLIVEGQPPIAGLEELERSYSWVLGPFVYRNPDQLAESLDEHVLSPAEAKRTQLLGREGGD